MIEKQQEEKLRLKSKFKKLQRKLVSEGKLDANGSLLDVKDNVEELERELVGVSQRHEDKQQVQERATTSSLAPAAERAKPVGKPQKHTGPSQIQRLAAKVEEEKEKARLAREEVLRQRAEKQATFEASLRERQRARQNHLRKTSRGQPLMKYRMQEILEVLEGKKKQKR